MTPRWQLLYSNLKGCIVCEKNVLENKKIYLIGQGKAISGDLAALR